MSEPKQLSLFDQIQPETTPTTPPDPDTPSALIPTNANIPIPPGTYQNWEQLTDHCQQCRRCELGSSRIQPVIGRGNLQAPIMIIGEAPGQNEDETGLPFVGKAGQLLEKILESVELKSDRDVFIANAIKCRPPDNRTPTPDEIAACKPYLLEQIRLINPQIILLTGATAVRALLPDEKQGISKIRGQWMQWEKRLCMPIFHPAYLLRNPSSEPGKPKWLMWQDMQVVKAKFDQLLNQ